MSDGSISSAPREVGPRALAVAQLELREAAVVVCLDVYGMQLDRAVEAGERSRKIVTASAREP